MPNPYKGNDYAAAYVDYYASPQMVQSSVDRLYHGGIQRKKAATVRATQEAYPAQPRPRRTQAEIDAYLQNRVEGELLKRQQRRVALHQEVYPEAEAAPRYLTEREMRHHLRHMYDEQLKLRKARREEMERIFGKNSTEKDQKRAEIQKYYRPPPGQSRKSVDPDAVLEAYEAQEQGWRPVSARIDYDDHRRALVSQYDYYADPRQFTEVTLRPRRLTEEDRRRRDARLEMLAQPVRITPAVVPEERPSGAPPPFRVPRKIAYEGE